MAQMALVATIKTVPGKRDEYLKHLKAHRERCLATEPDTLKFEILLPREEADTIMLYEVYTSPEAFEVHRTGPSMQQAKKDTDGLAVSMAGVRCNLAAEISNGDTTEFSGPVGSNARYRSYGVALSKKAVFSAVGRPVIYIPDDEGQWIPADQKWRQVKFEPPEVDWTHEREWRVQGDLDLKKVPGLYVIVWSPQEAKEIANLKCPVDSLIRAVLPMQHLNMML